MATGNQNEFRSELRMLSRTFRVIIIGLIIIIIAAYPLTGFYLIKTGETGIHTRFGKITDDKVAPGLHYRLPWPFSQIIKVETGAVHRFQTGFGADREKVDKMEEELGPLQHLEYGSFIVPYCITGDKNIIHLKIIGKYRISNPSDYKYGSKHPERLAILLIQSSIIDCVGRLDVDTVLTSGRKIIQSDMLEAVRKSLSELDLGITINSIEVKSTRPPGSVAMAFKDVVDARSEAETIQHEANSFRNQIIPEAKAKAARIINEADSYKTVRITQAEGRSEKFSLFAEQYERNRVLTCMRVYLSSMAEIMPSLQKIVLETGDKESGIDLKFLISDQ
jgi:modulator of FtsH protease HflK